MCTYLIAVVFLFSATTHTGFFEDLCDILVSDPFVCCRPVHHRTQPNCCAKIAKLCAVQKIEKNNGSISNTSLIDPTTYMMSALLRQPNVLNTEAE